MAWVLTRGMTHFRDSFNVAFPNRDKASDGTIGNQAHSVATSGHNPDKTGSAEYKDGDALDEVRAVDIDSDLRYSGTTMEDVVQHLVMLGRAGLLASVIKYLIYNKRIWRASNGWKTETYTGASQHTEHLHASGAYTQASDNNISFNYRLGEAGGFPVDQATFNKFLHGYMTSAQGKKDVEVAVWDGLVGSKSYPKRSFRQFVKDLWPLRDHLVGDKTGGAENPLSASSPMGQLLTVPATAAAIDSQSKSNGGGISVLRSDTTQLKTEVAAIAEVVTAPQVP
jgi:hypothetical protein